MKKTPLARGTKQLKRSGFKIKPKSNSGMAARRAKLRSKKGKPRKRKVSTLKKKLWPIFAKYIRARDRWKCISCGKYEKPGNAGHYIAKGACGAEYYFSELNVNMQCVNCNLTLEGNRHEYRKALVIKYGEDAVVDIEMNYHKPCPDFPYLERIQKYEILTQMQTLPL